VRWQRATSGPLDPGAAPVVCASVDETATGFPRQAYLDGVFSGTAAVDLGLAVDLVASFDGGSSWYAANLQGQRGFVPANRWGSLRALGQLEVEAGQAVRFGLRVSRLGAPGGATLSDSTCNLRIRIDNRNGFASPF
jgi:hypothetical protein